MNNINDLGDNPPLPRKLRSYVDQCVKCGLCSNHCPSFKILVSENENPRGRISIIQGLLQEQFPWDREVETHLGHCLGCLNCERVCPSGVRFAELIDGIKDLHHNQIKHGLPAYWSLLTRGRRVKSVLRFLLFIYQRSGLQSLLRGTRLFRLFNLEKTDSLLCRVDKLAWAKPHYLPTREKQGSVALFTGCVNPILDNHTIHQAIELLRRIGFEVFLPKTQQCCGAVYQHNGQTHVASMLLQENRAAFTGFKELLFLSTGCGAQLIRQQELLETHPIDINSFLHRHLTGRRFKPLFKKVALHIPCSQKNVVGNTQETLDLLRYIPQLNIELMNNDFCCGAGGTNMLQYPDMANSLLELKFQDLSPDIEFIVSSNIGCSLHMQHKNSIPIVHPLSLLCRQLLD